MKKKKSSYHPCARCRHRHTCKHMVSCPKLHRHVKHHAKRVKLHKLMK